jgi:hypothetical protein
VDVVAEWHLAFKKPAIMVTADGDDPCGIEQRGTGVRVPRAVHDIADTNKLVECLRLKEPD